MSSFMEWMDTDPFAAIVVMVVFVLFLFIAFALIDGMRSMYDSRRRPRRPYDGGCLHSPHTCSRCKHPSARR